MQYQPSMLSEVSKKRSIRDQSAQGDISKNEIGVQKTISVVGKPEYEDRSIQGSHQGRDISVQGTVQKFGDDKSIQGYVRGNDRSVQGTIQKFGDDKSIQGYVRGDDKSIQGNYRGDDKSVQGNRAPSLRDQSAQGEAFRTIPVSDEVSVRSFGMQQNGEHTDKSVQ
jgi:hypothetical protein